MNESYSQELDKIYYGIVSDSISRNHYLEFKNDSLVELSSIRRHMQKPLIISFSYHTTDGLIFIESDKILEADIENLKQYGFQQFIDQIVLKQDSEKAILDESNRIVYVSLEDFRKDNYTTYVVDGIEFRQDGAMTNSYGLLEKEPKRNRKLERKLKKIDSNLEDYNIKVYKGINAYESFGYEYVLGVIELKRK